MFYNNKTITKVLDSEIVEWDIKSANVSVMEYYQLHNQKTIDKLRALPKADRVKRVGILQRNPNFAKALEDGFNKIMAEFIIINSIPSENIISIKRDAIFVKNHAITVNQFGTCVEFVPKNRYLHYLKVNSLQFFIGREKIDVKGLSDTRLPVHENGILQFIRDVCKEGHDYYRVNTYLKEFFTAYKKKELPFDYYREFNDSSLYKLNEMGYEFTQEHIDESDMDTLDISYNLTNILIPVLQLFIN